MGRPTKLTPVVHAAIVDSLRAGVCIETAAEAAGVSASTVHAWIRRAEDHPNDCGEPFLEFHEAYKKARAQAELDAVQVIRAASRTTWQAAAWYLERSQPERWGRRTIVAGNGHKPFLVQLADLSERLRVDDGATPRDSLRA